MCPVCDFEMCFPILNNIEMRVEIFALVKRKNKNVKSILLVKSKNKNVEMYRARIDRKNGRKFSCLSSNQPAQLQTIAQIRNHMFMLCPSFRK